MAEPQTLDGRQQIRRVAQEPQYLGVPRIFPAEPGRVLFEVVAAKFAASALNLQRTFSVSASHFSIEVVAGHAALYEAGNVMRGASDTRVQLFSPAAIAIYS